MGHWLTEDQSAIIEIRPCAQDLCGKLVWPRDGKGARDERNPDPARRAVPVCGLDIIGGFRARHAGRWTSGSIYDPESGATLGGVSLSAKAGVLSVVIERGQFAGRETWRRVPAPAKPCRN